MRIMVALLALVLATSTARAENCETEEDAVPVETPAGTYYLLVEDCFPDECLFSIWVYEESNDKPGLQRGCGALQDEACIPECRADTNLF